MIVLVSFVITLEIANSGLEEIKLTDLQGGRFMSIEWVFFPLLFIIAGLDNF